MIVAIDRLLEEAFFTTEVENAFDALDEGHATFRRVFDRPGISFEVVLPESPSDDWLRRRVVGALLYHCQSTGIPVPTCPGVFVSLFIGGRLHCIAAADVLAWAAKELHETPDQWLALFGTHELETTIR
jgi:hypothetical protein